MLLSELSNGKYVIHAAAVNAVSLSSFLSLSLLVASQMLQYMSRATYMSRMTCDYLARDYLMTSHEEQRETGVRTCVSYCELL